jgi:hypothetical protein
VTLIRLAALQDSCAEPFGYWRVAALEFASGTSADGNPTLSAKAARREIYARVRETISSEELNCHGLYLFANLDRPDSLGQVVYVGLVNGQLHTLKQRMWDHLAKELTSLNPTLQSLDEEVAAREIRQLLRVVLPHSQRIDSYCRKHLKGRAMSYANAVLAFPTIAPAPVIDQAETALIQTAKPLAGESRVIVNKQKTKTSVAPPREALALAQDAVRNWQSKGLGASAANDWLVRLSRMNST